MRFHLIPQLHAVVEVVWRRVALQWVVDLPVEAIQMIEQARTETPAQPVARQPTHRRERAHAHMLQALAGIVGQCSAAHRHLVERAVQGRQLRHHHAVAQAGQHARGARRGCQRQPVLEAQGLQLIAQATLEARPGAEQAKAGTGFQHDGARPLLADQRTMPIRPGRKKALRARFVLRVVVDGAYLGHQGMRRR